MRFARIGIPWIGLLALYGVMAASVGWRMTPPRAVPERLALDTSRMAVVGGRAVLYRGDTITLAAAAYGTSGQRLTGQRIRWETILVPKGQPYAGTVSAGRFVAAGRLAGNRFGFVYGRVQWLTSAGAVKITVPFTFPVLERSTRPDSVATIGVAFGDPWPPWTASREQPPGRKGTAGLTALWNVYTIAPDSTRPGSPYWCQQVVGGDAARIESDTLVRINVNHGTPVGYGKSPVWCIPRAVTVLVVADDWVTVIHTYPAMDEG